MNPIPAVGENEIPLIMPRSKTQIIQEDFFYNHLLCILHVQHHGDDRILVQFFTPVINTKHKLNCVQIQRRTVMCDVGRTGDKHSDLQLFLLLMKHTFKARSINHV